MEMYIKVWKNQSATLLTANGNALSTYDSEAEAKQVRQAWYDANVRNPSHQNINTDAPNTDRINFVR